MEVTKIQMDDFNREVPFVEYKVGDNTFGIKPRISTNDLQELAGEMLGLNVILNDEYGIAYESYMSNVSTCLCVLSHYTNIDLSELETLESKNDFYDYVCVSGVYDKVLEVAGEQLGELFRTYDLLKESVVRSYESSKSLSTLIKGTFGSILSGGDMTGEFAKIPELNDAIVGLAKVAGRVDKPAYNFSKK